MPDTPREEITIPRPILLEAVKTTSKRHPGWPIPRLDEAITVIAHVGQTQGYKTARWLVPAEAAWMVAYITDARAVYGRDIPDDHPALIAQNALRNALRDQAPATCRSLSKQHELGEIVTCGHCRSPWSVTHTCEGQPEPVLPIDAREVA